MKQDRPAQWADPTPCGAFRGLLGEMSSVCLHCGRLDREHPRSKLLELWRWLIGGKA